MLKWIYILWPSFMTATLGEIVFFSLIDPQQLYLLGEPVDWSPIAVYSLGFFMFWALTASTVALCFLFLKPPEEINQMSASRHSGGRQHHLPTV